MKYCPNCGAHLKSDSEFCSNCGEPTKNNKKNINTINNKANSSIGYHQFTKPNFISSFKEFWMNCFNFNGRMSRASYWISQLEIAIIYIVIYILMLLSSNDIQNLIVLLYVIYYLAIIIPSISACCRRLHDTNHSGWFTLLLFVPIANIVVLIFLCMPSKNINNRFGSPDTIFLEKSNQ